MEQIHTFLKIALCLYLAGASSEQESCSQQFQIYLDWYDNETNYIQMQPYLQEQDQLEDLCSAMTLLSTNIVQEGCHLNYGQFGALQSRQGMLRALGITSCWAANDYPSTLPVMTASTSLLSTLMPPSPQVNEITPSTSQGTQNEGEHPDQIWCPLLIKNCHLILNVDLSLREESRNMTCDIVKSFARCLLAQPECGLRENEKSQILMYAESLADFQSWETRDCNYEDMQDSLTAVTDTDTNGTETTVSKPTVAVVSSTSSPFLPLNGTAETYTSNAAQGTNTEATPVTIYNNFTTTTYSNGTNMPPNTDPSQTTVNPNMFLTTLETITQNNISNTTEERNIFQLRVDTNISITTASAKTLTEITSPKTTDASNHMTTSPSSQVTKGQVSDADTSLESVTSPPPNATSLPTDLHSNSTQVYPSVRTMFSTYVDNSSESTASGQSFPTTDSSGLPLSMNTSEITNSTLTFTIASNTAPSAPDMIEVPSSTRMSNLDQTIKSFVTPSSSPNAESRTTLFTSSTVTYEDNSSPPSSVQPANSDTDIPSTSSPISTLESSNYFAEETTSFNTPSEMNVSITASSPPPSAGPSTEGIIYPESSSTIIHDNSSTDLPFSRSDESTTITSPSNYETSTLSYTERLKCGLSRFTCNTGKCIPVSLLCNAHSDCEDNSDELECDRPQKRLALEIEQTLESHGCQDFLMDTCFSIHMAPVFSQDPTGKTPRADIVCQAIQLASRCVGVEKCPMSEKNRVKVSEFLLRSFKGIVSSTTCQLDTSAGNSN